MKIGIIGAGNVGSVLGSGWHVKGHEVIYGVPTPDAEKYRPLHEYAAVTNPSAAAEQAEIVVLATPWPKTETAVKGLGTALDGKILVDCTNPLKPDLSGLTVGHNRSGGELIAEWAPRARVVKAFNTTGANRMAKPEIDGQKTVMFIASDDEEARQIVTQLAAELGFEAVPFGGLAGSRLLEPFALVWISLAFGQGFGRDFGFAILRD